MKMVFSVRKRAFLLINLREVVKRHQELPASIEVPIHNIEADVHSAEAYGFVYFATRCNY